MLTEILDAPTITEASSDPASPHLAKISGRFLAEGAKSANRRQYVNIGSWIERAQAKIDAGSSCDMRTCHEAGDRATEIVGKITKLNADGTYEGMIANTPKGHEVLPLIKGGYLKHVSLRARSAKAEPLPQEAAGEAGWVKITDVDGFGGIDFTNNPGIESASVSVLESAEGGEQVIESFQLEAPAEAIGAELAEDWETKSLPVEALTAALLMEREYSASERKKAAKEGAAMSDGSFPIYSAADLDNATHLWTHSTNPQAAKAHIVARAKTLGLESRLPYSFNHPDPSMESQGDEMTLADTINSAVDKNKEGQTTPATEAGTAPTPESGTPAGIAEAVAGAVEKNKTPETTPETTTPAPSQPKESATTPVESGDLKSLIEGAVSAALESERKAFQDKLAEERASHERKVEEMLNARRKTAAITESDATAEVEKMTLGQALKAYTTGAGLHK